jgi:hypothetical protein
VYKLARFVGRYGGEEFLLILNNCKPEYADARAEEIPKAVSSRPIQTVNGPLQVTMSFGVLFEQRLGCPAGRRIAPRSRCGPVLCQGGGTNLRSISKA